MIRMKGVGRSLWVLPLALSGAVTVGACEGQDISTGVESSTVNLRRCYGEKITCSASVQPTLGVEGGVRDCASEVTAALDREFLVDEGLEGVSAEQVEAAADGGAWVLVGSRLSPTNGPMRLLRFDAEGALLGASEPLLGRHAEAKRAREAFEGAHPVSPYRRRLRSFGSD